MLTKRAVSEKRASALMMAAAALISGALRGVRG
jgi:hypothetical protein